MIIFKFLIKGIFLIIFLAILFAFPTMWLWDYLMPSLFGLKTITFLQALALNILSGILFRTVNPKNYE